MAMEMNVFLAVPLTKDVELEMNVYSIGVIASRSLQCVYAFQSLPYRQTKMIWKATNMQRKRIKARAHLVAPPVIQRM